jgi:hypothetical protein
MYIQAFGKYFHPDHFACVKCKKKLAHSDGFYEHSGQAYCSYDYHKIFGRICYECNDVISTRCISALGKMWHDDCFKCKQCSVPLQNQQLFEYEGLPYCSRDYHLIKGDICGVCNDPILKGRFIIAMQQKFHPEHFSCHLCHLDFYDATTNTLKKFKEKNGKPYCVNCISS